MSDKQKTIDSADLAASTLSLEGALMGHFGEIFETARFVVRDADLAEDITQEVFLRVYRDFDSVPTKRLSEWLKSVTLNVTQEKHTAISDNQNRWAVCRNTPLSSEDYEHERRLAIEEARRALDKVREPMRSCLLLKQQGLSYREIATSLSLKETNVGSLVARARKEFAKVYGRIGAERYRKTSGSEPQTRSSILEEEEPDEARIQIVLDRILPELHSIEARLIEGQAEIEQLRRETRSIIATL